MVLGLFFLKYAHKFFWIESAEGNRHRICKKKSICEMSAKGNAWATNFQGPLGPRSDVNK